MKVRWPVRALEAACWITGAVLLAVWSAALIGGEAERRQAIAQFVQAREGFVPVAARPPAPVRDAHATARASVAAAPASTDASVQPIALLLIPRVAFEVPVFADTSERNLNRGAGWINGTAAPDEDGNIGIAGHRDRYFRILKDVVVGDVVELDSLSQRRTYRVTAISIVRPKDVSVLAPTDTAVLTLVTCFPFYYVGHAPMRYVVRAVDVSEAVPARDGPVPAAR